VYRLLNIYKQIIALYKRIDWWDYITYKEIICKLWDTMEFTVEDYLLTLPNWYTDYFSEKNRELVKDLDTRTNDVLNFNNNKQMTTLQQLKFDKYLAERQDKIVLSSENLDKNIVKLAKVVDLYRKAVWYQSMLESAFTSWNKDTLKEAISLVRWVNKLLKSDEFNNFISLI
jgi:hypothetical protein